MLFRVAADLLVLLHFGFILFVMLGGLAVYRTPRWALLHLPAAFWGALIEIEGWICPLTPLENRCRELGGATPYTGDFIGRYLLRIIYPSGLTRDIRFELAAIVLAANLFIYGYYIYRRRSGGHS